MMICKTRIFKKWRRQSFEVYAEAYKMSGIYVFQSMTSFLSYLLFAHLMYVI